MSQTTPREFTPNGRILDVGLAIPTPFKPFRFVAVIARNGFGIAWPLRRNRNDGPVPVRQHLDSMVGPWTTAVVVRGLLREDYNGYA